MLSDQAYEALGRIDAGAVLNPIHTTSRELINAGLACADWGRLRLTEAGRRVVRGRRMAHHFAADDESTADLWLHQDPFSPPLVSHPIAAATSRQEPVYDVGMNQPQYDEPAAVPSIDDHTKALRCAGVATGVTGHEPDTAWVVAFIEAWVSS